MLANKPEIPGRKLCVDCPFQYRYQECPVFVYNTHKTKMFNGRCYFDFLATKMKCPVETVYKIYCDYLSEDGHSLEAIVKYIMNPKNEKHWVDWRRLTNKEKSEYADHIYWPRPKYKKLFLAMADVYYNSFRDDEYVYCVRCGAICKNSTKHNRLICDDCAGRRYNNWRFCFDCGKALNNLGAKNTRQCRCSQCQSEHTKELSRERSRKYRERHANN